MNRSIAIAGALAAVLAVTACNRAEQAAEETGVGSNEVSNTVQDATSAAVGTVSAATLGANTTGGYVTNAAIGDMYEIAAGKLATERSQNADVKKFAAMLVTDHTKSSNELKAMSGQLGEGVTIPTEMDERRQGLVDNLRQASAADFDKVFWAQQVAAHNEALTLHRGYDGDNAGLKAMGTKTAPVVENHLQMAKAMEEKSKAAN